MNGKTDAFLVWDGGSTIAIPPAMGQPRSDQLQGTVREQLSELCGRVCYDSLGTGRDSAKYHQHIREVTHYSTVEAAAFTIELTMESRATREQVANLFLNRPSLWVDLRHDGDGGRIRATLNLRHLVDWEKHSVSAARGRMALALLLGRFLGSAAHDMAPAILGETVLTDKQVTEAADHLGIVAALVDEPETDEEKWISVWVQGSRGFSHELVRHGDWTAISQRSTRYVDESESPWVMHPLIEVFLREKGDAWGSSDVNDPRFLMQHTYGSARSTYDRLVPQLQDWLLSKGVDKGTARKQARGAARGFLGNALETQVIFSASVAEWRHVMNMRASGAADAEIREVACKVLRLLKGSRYGDRFADLELGPSPDGIGECLVGGGAR